MGEYFGIVSRRPACGISPNFLSAEPLPYILRPHTGDCTTVNRVGCLFLEPKPLTAQMERLVLTPPPFQPINRKDGVTGTYAKV
jgi:hypothetical protein